MRPLNKINKEDLLERYGDADAIASADVCNAPSFRRIEPGELLDGELSAVTFILGCYTVRSAQRVYKANDNNRTEEIPADADGLNLVRGELHKEEIATARKIMGDGGMLAREDYTRAYIPETFNRPWLDNFRVTQEISAKHNSDPYGTFTDGFKFVCRAGHVLNNKHWEIKIKSIGAVKKDDTLSDDYADLVVSATNMYITATSQTRYVLTPQGVLE